MQSTLTTCDPKITASDPKITACVHVCHCRSDVSHSVSPPVLALSWVGEQLHDRVLTDVDLVVYGVSEC